MIQRPEGEVGGLRMHCLHCTVPVSVSRSVGRSKTGTEWGIFPSLPFLFPFPFAWFALAQDHGRARAEPSVRLYGIVYPVVDRLYHPA